MKNNQPGMSLIVKTITRLTVGLILIYGIYIALSGSSGPGSGFAGGIIIALSFIQLMLAFGRAAILKKISAEIGLVFASFAALVFLFLTAFAIHKKIFSFGMAEIASAITVGFSLFVIFLSLVLLISARE
ncbi:MAG: MnhB domain-containing protein [Candidatus Omnitrophota bacterium]